MGNVEIEGSFCKGRGEERKFISNSAFLFFWGGLRVVLCLCRKIGTVPMKVKLMIRSTWQIDSPFDGRLQF